jgi:cytochrome c oxidase subunit 4
MEHQSHEQAHGASMSTYNMVFVVLAIVTLLELGAAELAGAINIIAVLALTTVKAVLVVAYYMHLKYEKPILTWLFVVPMIMGVGVIISLQGLAGY